MFKHAHTLLACLLLTAQAAAAEIQLRARAEATGRVVTLGDVADVLAAESGSGESLAEVELFPAPPQGQSRTVAAEEIRDTLALRGMNMARHRLSGAPKVVVAAAAATKPRSTATSVNASAQAHARSVVRKAVSDYLAALDPDLDGAAIEFALDAESARAVAAARGKLDVQGGQEPWTGVQQLTLFCASPAGQVELPLEVSVAEPRGAVVAATTINRGSILRAGDLRVERLRPGAKSAGFSRLDDVIGKEAARTLATGQMLDEQSVRSPILVRRGQVVTLYARGAGIQVRTTARSRDDGGLGELLTVETLHDRRPIAARVCGAQEVEVFGQSVQVAAEPARPSPAKLAAAPASPRSEATRQRAAEQPARHAVPQSTITSSAPRQLRPALAVVAATDQAGPSEKAISAGWRSRSPSERLPSRAVESSPSVAHTWKKVR